MVSVPFSSLAARPRSILLPRHRNGTSARSSQPLKSRWRSFVRPPYPAGSLPTDVQSESSSAILSASAAVGSAMSGVEINRLVVDQPALQLDLITDTTEQAETAQTILNGAMEGFVRWNRGSMRSGANGKTRVSITGYWVDSANQEPGS